MSQRLSLVVQVCTLAACAALVFVAWQMQEGQRTQQEAFLAALAKLAEPRETKPTTPPETRLAVQLKTSSPDDPLPESAMLRIAGTHLSNNDVKDEKYLDLETGRIDFGRIPPGAYFLRLQTQFGFATRQIEVAEGESRVEEFTAPEPEEPVKLELEIQPPAAIPTQDWKNADLVAFAKFERLPVTSGETKWSMSTGNIQVVISDAIERTLAPLEDLSRLGNPNKRFQFLVSMSRETARLREQQDASSPLTLPGGARYRLIALGVIANPDRFQMGRSGGDPYFAPVAAIWDNSHPDFPAWAKTDGNVFVAGNDESPPFDQQMFPWRIDIPEAMANEVLAQIQQNTELAAARVVQAREAAEQTALMLAAKERAARGPTQNRVRLRFVEGTKEGPAVLPVYLSLSAKGTAKPLSPVLDENGWADFGYLDAGLCTLQIMLAGQASTVRQFLVHPQKDYEEVIVCPPAPEPVSRRKFVVPLSEALKDKGIVASVTWEWKSPNAEKWSGWEFAAVRPFAKSADDASDSDQRQWINETFLSTADETTVVGEFATRPILIRPKSVQLNWPRPNEPGVSVVLGRAQFTDQPWLDLATANDDPITIGLPPDLLTKAVAELKKFTPMPIEEADAPGAKPLPQ
ncbi:MAG: hypothetical protein KF777_12315 [Planctomycetaceae bacterium]|nr:hypothetical protein [Planctomycetaceae bacterium]